MNDRERVLEALAHREVDRVPLDVGGRQTTLHYAAHQALMKHLGLRGPKPPIRSYHAYLVEPDPQLLRRFERVSQLFFPKPPGDYVFRIDPAANTYVDEWGTSYRMPPGGFYYDIHEVPLPDAETERDLKKYRWPDPIDRTRLSGIPEAIKAARAAGEKVLMLCGPMPGLWEHAWYIFGVEQAFANLAGNVILMEAFTERVLEWQIAFWGGGCDPVVMGTGTVSQVRDEVRRCIRDLAPGGGFVFGSVHNIQANVPPENIVAMFDAAMEFGGYPITVEPG